MQRRRERIRINMTSQRSGSRSNASEVGAGPIQAHPENPSANYTPNYEEIRLRAYEIYLERGSLSGNELDDWLQAEREIKGSAAARARVDR
jgi:hypothetical protein